MTEPTNPVMDSADLELAANEERAGMLESGTSRPQQKKNFKKKQSEKPGKAAKINEHTKTIDLPTRKESRMEL